MGGGDGRAVIHLPSSGHCCYSVAMEPWTVQHRVFTYDSYVRNNESVVAVQRDFRIHFNVGRHGAVPSRPTIMKWVTSFRTTGNIMAKKPPGATRTVRSLENIDRVRTAMTTSPGRSARRHASALHIGRESVRKILKLDLKFHPYKIVCVQELKENDYPQRLDFATQMQVLLHDEPDVLIFMSDEAHFYLNGTVNQQNCRYWAQENPRQLHEKPLHSPRVTVWCAVSRQHVIGPFFFEEDGVAVTVNANRYVRMINDFFFLQLQMLNLQQDVWFQQDGATAHTARVSMTLLRNLFPGHVISRFGDVPWPPRSPDLNICDFFLWGHLKEKVFKRKPRNLEDLKEAIREEVALITEETLQLVWQSFLNRIENCIREDGRHLPDLIFAS